MTYSPFMCSCMHLFVSETTSSVRPNCWGWNQLMNCHSSIQCCIIRTLTNGMSTNNNSRGMWIPWDVGDKKTSWLFNLLVIQHFKHHAELRKCVFITYGVAREIMPITKNTSQTISQIWICISMFPPTRYQLLFNILVEFLDFLARNLYNHKDCKKSI